MNSRPLFIELNHFIYIKNNTNHDLNQIVQSYVKANNKVSVKQSFEEWRKKGFTEQEAAQKLFVRAVRFQESKEHLRKLAAPGILIIELLEELVEMAVRTFFGEQYHDAIGYPIMTVAILLCSPFFILCNLIGTLCYKLFAHSTEYIGVNVLYSI